jgi:hypothetical protein
LAEQRKRTPTELLPIAIDRDRRWLPLPSAHLLRYGRVGNARRAASDLQWALKQGHLRCLCVSFLDGGTLSLVLPWAWGNLITLAVSDSRAFVLDCGTGDEINYYGFWIWDEDLDEDIRWPSTPAPTPALTNIVAPPDQDRPYLRPPLGTKIKRHTIIEAIIDHDLRHVYPERVPPNTSPSVLRAQCEPFWRGACIAHDVKFRLPEFPTFKRYVLGLEEEPGRQQDR